MCFGESSNPGPLGVWVLKTKGIEKMMQAPKAQGGIEALHCPWAFVHLPLMQVFLRVLRFVGCGLRRFRGLPCYRTLATFSAAQGRKCKAAYRQLWVTT